MCYIHIVETHSNASKGIEHGCPIKTYLDLKSKRYVIPDLIRDPEKLIKNIWIPACAGMTAFLMGQP